MTSEVIKVHGTNIDCPFHNDQHYVAIRPICKALGIDHQKQFDRIKNDPILGQLYTDTVYNSGSDGKSYKMLCLPLKYVFGWLFSIDESKINEKAKPSFRSYKMECYNALYEHFYLRTALYERRERLLAEKRLKVMQMKADRSNLNGDIKKLEEEIETLQNQPIAQLELSFSEN